MIVPFNRMNVDVSCIGNHELDHGFEVAKNLINSTNSQWIISNITQLSNGRPILNIQPYHIISTQGFKIGLMGFAEKDWTEILNPELDLSGLSF